MMTAWRIQPYKRHDKDIILEGPNDLELVVDFDDVNHAEVEAALPIIVDALNKVPAWPQQDWDQAPEDGIDWEPPIKMVCVGEHVYATSTMLCVRCGTPSETTLREAIQAVPDGDYAEGWRTGLADPAGDYDPED